MISTINKDNHRFSSTTKHEVLKYKKDEKTSSTSRIIDQLTPESPLELILKIEYPRIQNITAAITMRSPGNDRYLALGFCLSEGIINHKEDVLEIEELQDRVSLTMTQFDVDLLKKIERNFYTSSSCGICSKKNISQLYPSSSYLSYHGNKSYPKDFFYTIPSYFNRIPGIFKQTGSTHSTILLNHDLKVICSFEDVGRHNSMDKTLGYALLNDLLPLNNYILLVSGRISFELVQKASMAGASVIAALGAPSDLAVEEAYAQNITIVGFCKSNSFNVYTGKNRING